MIEADINPFEQIDEKEEEEGEPEDDDNAEAINMDDNFNETAEDDNKTGSNQENQEENEVFEEIEDDEEKEKENKTDKTENSEKPKENESEAEKEEDEDAPNKSYSVYVGHLNKNITKEDIIEAFKKYGKIVKVYMQTPTRSVYKIYKYNYFTFLLLLFIIY